MTSAMPETTPVDQAEPCATCAKPLGSFYLCCDETMGAYCPDCWPLIRCEELHGEECATQVWSDGKNSQVPETTPVTEMLTASVRAYNCDNPNHRNGCGLGWRLTRSSEEDAHTWIAAVDFGDRRVWQCKAIDGTSREKATAALFDALEKGIGL